MPDQPDRLELAAEPAFLEAEVKRMRRDPRPLERPVVVLGGWRSPHIMVRALARRVRELTSGRREDFLCVSYPFAASVESAAAFARARIEEWVGRGGSTTPMEIDAVAISMGGLVARLLAAEPSGRSPPRRIARLFTFSTPHAGASLARWVRPDAAAAAMRPGSAMLARLDAAARDPARCPGEITCYVQRRDWWIGTWNAAAPGRVLRWTRTRGPFSSAFSHFTSHRHPVLIVDLARRLRGEPGLDERSSVSR